MKRGRSQKETTNRYYIRRDDQFWFENFRLELCFKVAFWGGISRVSHDGFSWSLSHLQTFAWNVWVDGQPSEIFYVSPLENRCGIKPCLGFMNSSTTQENHFAGLVEKDYNHDPPPHSSFRTCLGRQLFMYLSCQLLLPPTSLWPIWFHNRFRCNPSDWPLWFDSSLRMALYSMQNM